MKKTIRTVINYSVGCVTFSKVDHTITGRWEWYMNSWNHFLECINCSIRVKRIWEAAFWWRRSSKSVIPYCNRVLPLSSFKKFNICKLELQDYELKQKATKSIGFRHSCKKNCNQRLCSKHTGARVLRHEGVGEGRVLTCSVLRNIWAIFAQYS